MSVSDPDPPRESASEVAKSSTHSTGLGLKRQLVWSMLPLLVLTVVNIVSVRLFYRFLGAEGYALWFNVTTLSGSFGFLDLGVGVAVGRYIGVALGGKDMRAVREYWGTGNLMAIPVLALMSLVFIGVGVVFGPKWFQVSPENVLLLQWSFVAGGVAMFTSYYATFWLILSQAHFDFRFIGVLRSILNVSQVIAAIGLAYWTRNPLILICVGIVANVVQLAVFVVHARRHYQLGFNLRDALLSRAREMLAISGKSFATVLVGSFGLSIDRLLLGKLAPPAAFTHYNIATNFGARIQGLGVSVMGPVFHQTSRAVGRGSHESAMHIYDEMFNFTFGFYALGAFWAAFWQPIFLRVWLGPELASHVAPVFTPLIIAYCLSGAGTISAAQMVPLNRAGMEFVFGILNMVSLGIGALVGWHLGGLVGLAWGVLASRVAIIARDLYVIRLIGGGGWLAMRTWWHLLAQGVVGAVFYLASWVLPRPSFWELIPAALHAMVVLAWLFRHQLKKLWLMPSLKQFA